MASVMFLTLSIVDILCAVLLFIYSYSTELLYSPFVQFMAGVLILKGIWSAVTSLGGK